MGFNALRQLHQKRQQRGTEWGLEGEEEKIKLATLVKTWQKYTITRPIASPLITHVLA
jgi:hypothetical protein